MFKKSVLAFLLLFMTSVHAMPGYDFSYGQWKKICGQPGPACDLFLSGFLHSADFWKQWLSEASSLRPDLENAEKIVGYLSVYSDNGKLCLPDTVQFESVRKKVNKSLQAMLAGDGGGYDRQVINHEVYRVNLYQAFKIAYPCEP